MPEFSEKSKAKLAISHADLQRLFNEVVKKRDCTVVWGYRNKYEQDEAYEKGFSTFKFPYSKHNRYPSHAVDVIPFVNGRASWKESDCYFFAGYVERVAEELGISIRLGADWDGDHATDDQQLKDPAHFELDE